jgi:hypothetical protein
VQRGPISFVAESKLAVIRLEAELPLVLGGSAWVVEVVRLHGVLHLSACLCGSRWAHP